ncbi:hypothetical protein KR51_00006990 [Rubidibacter lacunae KORDI 51-2]|uniref:Uncharacterized protein n=1 Tax=Rubidibacter lacunae KORDI 51-2 TaxID=582515 RepID=U5DP53_9CHRO|nr:hypothetical protein KR51_00006990 [Rubidibacter lacunae KORDI 51-2]
MIEIDTMSFERENMRVQGARRFAGNKFSSLCFQCESVQIVGVIFRTHG